MSVSRGPCAAPRHHLSPPGHPVPRLPSERPRHVRSSSARAGVGWCSLSWRELRRLQNSRQDGGGAGGCREVLEGVPGSAGGGAGRCWRGFLQHGSLAAELPTGSSCTGCTWPRILPVRWGGRKGGDGCTGAAARPGCAAAWQITALISSPGETLTNSGSLVPWVLVPGCDEAAVTTVCPETGGETFPAACPSGGRWGSCSLCWWRLSGTERTRRSAEREATRGWGVRPAPGRRAGPACVRDRAGDGCSFTLSWGEASAARGAELSRI